MKKGAICLFLFIIVAASSLGASAQTKNSSSQGLNETLWKTAVQAGNPNCSNCITRCASIRDTCRTNACGIIGARSNGPQACTDATNDTPGNHKRFTDALNACFAQERN